MLRSLIRWRLEKQWWLIGESKDCLLHMLRISLPAFATFQKLVPIASYRRRLPRAALHVARILAVQDEDCGSCVQIAVNIARRGGMTAKDIRAVVSAHPEELPEDLAIVYKAVRSALDADVDHDEHRQAFRDRFGEEALIELAMIVATSRVFPVTKRVLGYATTCARVDIDVDGSSVIRPAA